MASNNFNIEENNYFNQLNNIEFEDGVCDDRNKPGPKYNVIFQDTAHNCTSVILNSNRTVNEMLIAYLKKIKKSELIDKILFLYNAEKLYFGNKTLISNLFERKKNPNLTVIWQNEVIGGP